jgi:CHAT domain-containing protein
VTDPTKDRRFPRASNTLLVIVILGIAAVAVGLVPLSPPLENDQGNLIRGLSGFRVDGQRLFHAQPSPFDTAQYTEVARRAQVFLLTAGDTGVAARVRALLAVGSGRLREAAVILESLADRESPEILNDLGVAYWGLGEENPSNYFRALMAFERAAQLSPDVAAPRFNAALAYRKVELHDLADAALREYQRIDRSSFWAEELSRLSTRQLVSMDELGRRLEAEDVAGATSLLQRDPGAFRSTAIEYALNPPEAGASDRAMQFVLNYFATQRGEETVKAILAPLGTRSEHGVLNGRRLTHLGVAAYFQSKFSESLHFYDLAETAMRDTGSGFDELWLKLKRADTRLRLARSDAVGRRLDIEAVHRLLDEVIAKSRSLKYDWLLGHALASKGVASMTIRNQDEILPLLREAVDKLTVGGAAQDAARPLYYLATIHFLAGDFETILPMIYRSLHLTQPDDHIRQAELYWLAGVQLYRMGFERYGLLLEKQALNEALASQNYGLVSFNASFLAMMNVAVGEYEAAKTYQHQARMVRDSFALPTEREAADLSLNLLCGQLSIATGNLKEGEECLNRLLAVLKTQPKPAPEFFAQALLQLARIHSLRGEFDLARQQFREATDVIEQNDEYLATTALRTPFENQRRNLYEAAISFEYDHDGKDAAWGYTQQYRSKLFLEFLRQMNPGLVLDQAIERSRVHELIPSDVQVVEYVILKDRLLIWLVSKDKFVSTSVPVSRHDLETKVTDFVERVNRKGNVIPQSEALYNLLVGPIEPELDPKRALAIIPDQALHRLNFPALSSAAKRTFLIQQYTLLESPNLTTLLSGPSSNTPSRRLAVSFGARTDNTGATRELRALGQFYNEIRSFNGDTAVKPAFLSSLGTASVFHYAGHSQDAADPLRSSILLDGEREGPNSVTAVDISRRKMPPNSVVVLASCDSSVGNSRDGIGMRGLTSAFLISGAGSVVGSLWRVEAESTSQLVLRFHQNFAGNRIPVAAALRDAQLASIKEGAHPYYWSGFVVTGNTSALR